MTPGRRVYLLCYNFNNAVLWSVVLFRALYNVAVYGFEGVQPRMGDFVMFVQSIAILEILHSAFGTLLLPGLNRHPTIVAHPLAIETPR